jgi:exosortase A
MNAITPPTSPAASTSTVQPGAGWTTPLVALAIALAAWGALFATEIAAAVAVWDSSTAYNHCWLILPIAGWLGWQRRARLRGLVPAPSARLALLMLPLGVGWLLAERLGIMEGRQLAALAIAVVMTVVILGEGFGRAMLAPLAYLVFLVPFGAFTVPALQRVTSRIIEFLLGFTGIPHFVDDIVIEIPAGTFLVAEACAGLRFLIAAIAFGALYALVMFRSPGRRVAVMVLSVVVPIVANGLRGFGLVMLGHVSGSAAAVDADHVLYGWVFFSIVLLLLILVGLPFREDGAAPAVAPLGRQPAPRGVVAFGTVAVLAVGVAATGPVAAEALDSAGRTPPTVLEVALDPPEGCVAEAQGARLRCGEMLATARVIVFSPRTNWSAVVAERHRLLDGSDVDMTYRIVPPGGAAVWDVRQPNGGGRARAVATWLDGRPAGAGVRDRARQAWNALSGGSAQPVVAGVEIRAAEAGTPTGRRERDVLEQVLAAQTGELVARAVAVSRVR